MTDWTQSGEQAFIDDWLARRNHAPGRFLDIGATDGTTASNTRKLAAIHNWGGVCVEPAAWAFDKLSRLYAGRDDIDVVQVAIADPPHMGGGVIEFHYSRGDLVSTTVDRYAETWSDLVAFERQWIAAMPVSDLLLQFPGPYELISVDTEGTSLRVAKDLLDDGALAPGGLLCVECENGGERWQAQQWCLDGYARVGTTPNNLLLEKL